MQRADYPAFTDLMDSLAGVYGSRLSAGGVALYWEALTAYPFEAVQHAIRAHTQDLDKGRFMPRPTDLIGRLGQPREARAGQCSYVRPTDGEPCRFAGTMSASISGGGPYYCRMHFPPTSNPRFWDDAVTASLQPRRPPQNWRDALCDQLLQARGIMPGGADRKEAEAPRWRDEFKALVPTFGALPAQRCGPAAGPPAEPAPRRREETERLLAEARARYQPAAGEPVRHLPLTEPEAPA